MYRKWIIAPCLFSIFLLSTLLTFTNYELLYGSESPYFAIQKSPDHINDWFEVNSDTSGSDMYFALKRNNYQIINPYADIKEVDYFSDGKRLNSTFWVARYNGSIADGTTYGIYLRLQDDPATNSRDADYSFRIVTHNNTSWEEILEQRNSFGGVRSIYEKNVNKSDIFDEQYGILNLSLDLHWLNYPQKYSMNFFSTDLYVLNNTPIKIADYNGWVEIPPDKIEVLFSPDPLEIYPGQEKSLNIDISHTSEQNTKIRLEESHENRHSPISITALQNDTRNLHKGTTPFAMSVLASRSTNEWTVYEQIITAHIFFNDIDNRGVKGKDWTGFIKVIKRPAPTSIQDVAENPDSSFQDIVKQPSLLGVVAINSWFVLAAIIGTVITIIKKTRIPMIKHLKKLKILKNLKRHIL
jgi:hypothetical protein